ncbi:helix-turn-helix domain-containing protein [bacterium]|nr:helix-turn-helix domain-containing protein [bacterium]
MNETATFADALRVWRTNRRMSQLELSLTSEVSSRHLSFLETGRARPSRDMVLRICDALLIPRAARNELLRAAGFAPIFPATPLDSEVMAPFRRVVDDMIRRHAPYPAMLTDRCWNLIDANPAGRLLLSPFGDGAINLVRELACNPIARDLICNWSETVAEMASRIRLEVLEAGDDPALMALLRHLEQALDRTDRPRHAPLRRPVAPLEINAGGRVLAFLSTIVHFGTSEDVTVRDLRLELLFPADEATRLALIESAS